MEKDYYKILGVDENAEEKQIKEAFRRLALQYHPDRNRDNPEASAIMKDLNESYAVLSDPRKRREYDSMKQIYGHAAYEHFKQSYTEQDIFRGSDIQHILNELSRAFGFRNFDEIFRDLQSSGQGAFEFRSNRGRGFFYSYGTAPAPGSGQFLSSGLGKLIRYGLEKTFGVEFPRRGKDIHDRISLPFDLASRGGKIQYASRKLSKDIMVKIPAGIKEGQQIRLKGLGEEGKGGGEPGDLLIRIRLKKPLYRRIAALFGKSGP